MKPKFLRTFRNYRVDPKIDLCDLEAKTGRIELKRDLFTQYKSLLANPLYWNNWGRYLTTITRSEEELEAGHDRLFYRAVIGIDFIHDYELEQKLIRNLDKYLQLFPIKRYQLRKLIPLTGLVWKDGTTPNFKNLLKYSLYKSIIPTKLQPFFIRILPTRIDIEDSDGQIISVRTQRWALEYRNFFKELN